MTRIRWLALIVVAVTLTGLGPWTGLDPSPLAQSRSDSEPTSYVLVTLEELSVDGLDSNRAPRLMLGAVTASGERVRTQIWPDAIWAEARPERGAFLDGEAEAVPLFALPEDDMGERLAFGVIALDNRVSENESPQDWLNTRMPALVEAASGPVARWGRAEADAISASQERERIGDTIQPLVGPNRSLGILTGRFAASDDWGIRQAPYETSVTSEGVRVTMRYRVRRVEAPAAGDIGVRLQRLRWMERSSAQLFLWSRASTGFSGEDLNALPRRLPLSDTLNVAANGARSMNSVFLDGSVGPFLYLNVGAWDQSTGRPQALGQLTRFWTVEELLSQRPSTLSLETNSLALDLAFEVPRQPQQSKVYWAVLNRIQRANLDGSNVEDVVTGLSGDVRGVAVDATNRKLYWALPNRIQRADLDGSNVETVVAGLRNSDPTGVAVDARNGWIYWSDIAGNGTTGDERIQRARLNGSNRQTLVSFDDGNPGNPGDIALDLNNRKMYWANTNPFTSKVQRANLDGSQLETLEANLEAPSGLALDLSKGHVYWTDVNTNKVQRADLDGRRVEDVVTLENSLQNYLDLDPQGGKMYWTDKDRIRRANLDGSNVETIVSDLLRGGGLAQALGIALFVPPSD